ncbi:MAG: hypothetical protein U5L00_18870 [Desulfovermiculus sp.]|nr:hypothetical protein [Desulfovermiculus sp.]
MFPDIRGFKSTTKDGAHHMVAGRVRKGLERVLVNGRLVGETAGRIREAVLALDGRAAWVEESPENKMVRMMTTDGVGAPRIQNYIFPQFTEQNECWPMTGQGRRSTVSGHRRPGAGTTMGVSSKYRLTPDGVVRLCDPECGRYASMVIDGRIGPAYKGIWNPARLSPDGSRSLYVANTENGAVLVVDEQEFDHPLRSSGKFPRFGLEPGRHQMGGGPGAQGR